MALQKRYKSELPIPVRQSCSSLDWHLTSRAWSRVLWATHVSSSAVTPTVTRSVFSTITSSLENSVQCLSPTGLRAACRPRGGRLRASLDFEPHVADRPQRSVAADDADPGGVGPGRRDDGEPPRTPAVHLAGPDARVLSRQIVPIAAVQPDPVVVKLLITSPKVPEDLLLRPRTKKNPDALGRPPRNNRRVRCLPGCQALLADEPGSVRRFLPGDGLLVRPIDRVPTLVERVLQVMESGRVGNHVATGKPARSSRGTRLRRACRISTRSMPTASTPAPAPGRSCSP